MSIFEDFFMSILELLPIIIFFAIFIIATMIKQVPKDTVYIIDKHTHYHKTVKNGFFFLNPTTHSITTKISKNPITVRYTDVFETEDGKNILASFNVTYSAQNMEDVLYNLEKVRRSIDDILKSCMYSSMLSLNSKVISKQLLMNVFKYNLESQAMSFGLNIHNYNIMQISLSSPYGTTKAFRPHKNYSDSPDPIQYT